ncbi:hypothetical protein PQX77_011272 [Marasmius sp. AFHP31]|nr:hypothetical protein PQX77_011272 [Marasmius sp. AFHP31]
MNSSTQVPFHFSPIPSHDSTVQPNQAQPHLGGEPVPFQSRKGKEREDQGEGPSGARDSDSDSDGMGDIPGDQQDTWRDTPPHKSNNRFVTRSDLNDLLYGFQSLSLVVSNLQNSFQQAQTPQRANVGEMPHAHPNEMPHALPPYATVPIPQHQFQPLPHTPQFHQPLPFPAPFVQQPFIASYQSCYSDYVPSLVELQTSASLLLAYMSSTTPSIPSTTTIPILHGQDNFAQWHEAATGMIQNLGLNSWICGPTPENFTSFNLNIVPVYPPSMSNNPTPEYQIWQVFWARDGVATFVLTSRLSPNVASLLPPNLDPTTGVQRTSRDIINILRERYGVYDFSGGQYIKETLYYTSPRSQEQIPEFVVEWRKQLNVLRNAQYPISWAEAITRFLALLPNHPVWEQLRKMGSDATATDPLSLNHDSWEFIANSVLRTDADCRSRYRVQTAANAMTSSVNRTRPNNQRGGADASHSHPTSSNPSNTNQNRNTHRSERSDRNMSTMNNPPSSNSS